MPTNKNIHSFPSFIAKFYTDILYVIFKNIFSAPTRNKSKNKLKKIKYIFLSQNLNRLLIFYFLSTNFIYRTCCCNK